MNELVPTLCLNVTQVSRGTPTRQLKQDLVGDLQNLAMTEHGDFHDRWESECKQLKLHRDREALLSKLKPGIQSGGEMWCLGSYLAHKLTLRHMHAREALAVTLNVPELLHNKVLLGE